MVRLVLFALLTAAIEVGLAHSRQVGSTLTCNGRARRCLDCKSLVRCSKRNGVYWPLRATACPPATPYCHDGHCVTSPPKEICSTTAEPKINSEFLCVANGYYPDPSSCRRYYFCVENVAYQYECVGNSVYHHQAAMCVGSGAVCSTTACTSLLVGKYQLYEQDPTVYVVCMDTNPANALVARCPRNHTMSENTVSCQPACTGPGRYAVSHGTRKADPSEYYECVEINNNQYEGPVRKTCPGTSVFSKEMQRCVQAPVQPPTTTTLPEPDSNTEISTSRQTDISTTTKTFVTTQSTLTTASSFETPSQNRSVTTASMLTEPTTTTGKPASTTNTKNDSSSMTVSPSLRTSTHSFDISSAETIYSSMATKNQTEPTTITTSFSTEQLVTDNGNTETNSDSTTASPSLPTSTQSIDKSSAETSPSEIFTEKSTTTTPTVYSSIATQHQTKPTTVNTMGPISLSTENLVTDDVTTETDSDSTNASPILPTSTQSIDTSAETSPSEIFTEQSTSTAATVYSSLATEHQTEATAVTRVGPITFSTEEQVTDSSNTETNSDSTTASPNLSISTQSIDTSSAETIPSEIFTEESTAITTTIYSSMATTLQTEPTTITTVGPTSFSTQQLVTDNASTNASPSLATSTQSINTSSAKTSPPEIFTEESMPPATTVYTSIATKQTETTTVITVRPITFSTEQQVTDNGNTETYSDSTNASPSLDTSTQSIDTSSAETSSSEQFTEKSTTTTAIVYSSISTELQTEPTPLITVGPITFSTEQLVTDNANTGTYSDSTNASSSLDTSTQSINTSSAETSPSEIFTERSTTTTATVYSSISTELQTEPTPLITVSPITFSTEQLVTDNGNTETYSDSTNASPSLDTSTQSIDTSSAETSSSEIFTEKSTTTATVYSSISTELQTEPTPLTTVGPITFSTEQLVTDNANTETYSDSTNASPSLDTSTQSIDTSSAETSSSEIFTEKSTTTTATVYSSIPTELQTEPTPLITVGPITFSTEQLVTDNANTETDSDSTNASPSLDTSTQSVDTSSAETSSSEIFTEKSTTTTSTVYSSISTELQTEPTPLITVGPITFSTEQLVTDDGTTETDSDSTSASPSLATSTQTIDTSAETSPSEIFTEQSTSTATAVYSSIATQHQTKPTTVNTVGPISLSTEQLVTDNGNTETNSEESMSTTTSFYSSLATELQTKPSTETLVTESGSTPAALVTTNTNTPPFSFTPYFSTERSTSQTMTTQGGITDFSPLTDQTFISTERLTTYNGYTVPHLTSSVSDSSEWDTSTPSTDAYIVSSGSSQSFPEQLTTSAITYSTSLATELETESTMSAQSDTAALTTLTTINSSEDFTTDMSTKADRSSTTETLTPSTASSGVPPSGAREDFFTPNASVNDDLYIMPTNFRLGATSSAYQTEGAWDTDGKGPSIQDNFYHGSGGDSGDIACNSYAEYLVDVNLLRNMSFQTYHFSMSWSRLLPTGSSLHANQVAINFYDKLLRALIENHIEPVVTLHHWDIPSGIVNGWLNSSAPDYFLDYATFAFSLFGSRVSTWLLLHDPVTLCVQGYAEGQIGPGIVDSQGTAAYRCVHNQILAHAQAYRAYRRDFADWQQGRVGSTLFLDYGQPQNASSAADAAAAERFMEASFAWVADPLFTGRYPDSLRQAAGDKLPSFTPAQMTLVAGSTDFLGLKHSSARLCTEGQRTAQISFSNDVNVATRLDEKWLRTPGGQDAITPWSIRGALNWIDERYNGVQVLVTENGYSGSADNDIDDVKRSAYFSAYLRGVMRAVNEDRCNVMGYAARSLTDSFEWNNGYNVKYGLAHVDFSLGSRPRLLKPAPASFFRNVLQNRSVDFVAFISP